MVCRLRIRGWVLDYARVCQFRVVGFCQINLDCDDWCISICASPFFTVRADDPAPSGEVAATAIGASDERSGRNRGHLSGNLPSTVLASCARYSDYLNSSMTKRTRRRADHDLRADQRSEAQSVIFDRSNRWHIVVEPSRLPTTFLLRQPRFGSPRLQATYCGPQEALVQSSLTGLDGSGAEHSPCGKPLQLRGQLSMPPDGLPPDRRIEYRLGPESLNVGKLGEYQEVCGLYVEYTFQVIPS
jgi:hypothetical protein